MKETILSILLGVACVCFSVDASEKSYWVDPMVRQYVHHSELQRRWAWAALSKYSFKGNESVLDIGTGDGKIAADLSNFVPKGRVLGIDPSVPMLEWAKKQFHPKEYPNLAFQLGSFLEPSVSDKFDLITSFCALQFAADQVGALKVMEKLLEPKGKILLTFPAEGNLHWKNARTYVQNSEKWKTYWKDKPLRKWYLAEEYRKIVSESGLKAVRVEKVETIDPFIDKQEFIDWLKGVFPPVVPSEKQDEFFAELIDYYVSLNPKDHSSLDSGGSGGVIFARFGRIEVELTRR